MEKYGSSKLSHIKLLEKISIGISKSPKNQYGQKLSQFCRIDFLYNENDVENSKVVTILI